MYRNNKLIKTAFSGIFAFILAFSVCPVAFAANDITTTINGETVAVMPEEEPFITIDRVNFRTGPATSHKIISTLNPGVEVEFIANYGTGDNSWTEIRYNNTTGYIKSEFLSVKSAAPKGDVELLSWAEAKEIFIIGLPAAVYDIRSGLTYFVKSFSNGSHADVEPITKDDTAIMYKTYGNQWKWDPRPVWVTINGRTLAASINGMPHGGGVNSENGMNGQVCLHFPGSTTHNGNDSFTKWHQDVLMEAYNLSLTQPK